MRTSFRTSQRNDNHDSNHASNHASNPVHCAMLGDGMIGKTSLTLSYSTNHFNDEYTATMLDSYEVAVHNDGQHFILSVQDTAGQSDFEDLRTLTYKDSEVLVLCFSVCDRDSFNNIFTSWIPEIKRHTRRRRPIILVGTQTDMRTGCLDSEVTQEEGRAMAKLVGAVTYVECSAKNRSGLHDVFCNVLGIAMRRRKRKNSFLGRLFQR
ncbi:cdc42 homolog [Physella acuta]|uniref:cdc42 homolog n=1 Tax=Physella acuta TaxID=109671 RepID=UPI0027DCAF4D|nr:cdc42 homolog [Physella acuta]